MPLWTRIWAWVTTPTGATLGPREWLVILAGGASAFVGVFVAEASEARRRALLARALRYRAPVRGEPGPGEYGLAADLRVKGGVGLAVWSGALILAILFRLFGTPGLTTNILPALTLVTLVVLVGYVVVYRLVHYPRCRDEARRIDTRKAYEPVGSPSARAKGAKQKQGAARTTRSVKIRGLDKPTIDLMPGTALIGLLATPFISYFLMTPHPPTMHDVHQIGMLIAALLGYLIGLALSLGDGVLTGSFWARRRPA